MKTPASASRAHLRSLGLSCALALAFAGIAAARAGPGGFSAFAGAFRGNGHTVGADGQRQSLSCRATGAAAGEGRALSQNIVCESAAYKFDIRAHFLAEGDAARGDWREATRGVSGEIAGGVTDRQFTGESHVDGFSGRFRMHAGPRKLVFTFWPDEGSIRRIHGSLARLTPLEPQVQEPLAPPEPVSQPSRRARPHRGSGLILLN
jgi:hypothetical protein